MVFCNLGGAFASLIVYDVGLDYSFRAMFLFLSPFALSGAILAFYFKFVYRILHHLGILVILVANYTHIYISSYNYKFKIVDFKTTYT